VVARACEACGPLGGVGAGPGQAGDLAGRYQRRCERGGEGIPGDPEFRLHRRQPLATIEPPRH
jgi:hypothetical protein